MFYFINRKAAYEMTCAWSSDVCSSDLLRPGNARTKPLASARCQVEERTHHGASVGRELVRLVDLARREQIGRASCRERGSTAEAAGDVAAKELVASDGESSRRGVVVDS